VRWLTNNAPGAGAGVTLLSLLALLASLTACSGGGAAGAGSKRNGPAPSIVGVTVVTRKPIVRQLTVSSELVPFQEIDVYAKESGYVKRLLVDYGSRVHVGQLMAVLEIPELEMQLRQDAAAIQTAADQVAHATHEVSRLEAQQRVAKLEYDRLNGVATARPGLVAQQEVDDAEGKALASEAQVESARSALTVAQSQVDQAEAMQERDQALFGYARITAPFAGVVTQRYANYGTLVQAGTSSSTQVLPIVRLSEDDKFRLVIPVPESCVRFVRLGSQVRVRVPSLDKVFPGTIARFSVDVAEDTRTMHTEVDVPNPNRALMPGLYAEATLDLESKNHVLCVPLAAVSQAGGAASVFLVDPDNRLEDRKISLGLETASDAEVLSGLAEGDRVVVSDRSGLRTGAVVRPETVSVPAYQADQGQQ